jgi:hypothetical protein
MRRISYRDGVNTIRMRSWREYVSFINDELIDKPNYAYRGHANASWSLLTSFDRNGIFEGKKDRLEVLSKHLQQFRYASRGRRGSIAPPNLTDDELWALGQHNGLNTPLLDWTESPFAALYFAFAEKVRERVKYRAVYAIGINAVEEICTYRKLKDDKKLRFFKPLTDENPRLVSQRGLFSIGGSGRTIESWIKIHYRHEDCARHLRQSFLRTRAQRNDLVVLCKIEIPNKGVSECLQFLNKMNINHLSLFPDLYGSTQYCNLALEIEDYV